MSSLNKLKKLRRMSGDEIRCRLRDKMTERRERKLWKKGEGARERVASLDSSKLLQRCAILVPGTDSAELDELKQRWPNQHQRMATTAAENAAKILQGKWELLGHPYDFSGEVDWHADDRTGYQWERTFYADLPLYNLAGETDIKYPWELSRHQFLCELSRNYLLNGCEDSATRARHLLIDWIESNPLYEGVNWTSALEVAMRVMSWTWTMAGMSQWKGWSQGDLDAISNSLTDHGRYLADHFSYYSSPYNHLIGEAAGLLFVTSLVDDPSSSQWRTQAVDTLLKSGPAQFYEDHFCVEQAVGYHYYTLGFLCLAYLVEQRRGDSANGLASLQEPITSAFSTGAAFRRPDGTWPAIGDLDSARAIPVAYDEYWNFDSLQNLAASMFDAAALKIDDAGPGEEAWWLGGSDFNKRWDALESPRSENRSWTFRDSGYAIAADKNDWLLMDAGSISAGLFPDATPSTAHGHADTLQLMYCADGQTVLDDCGMPYYGGDQDWVGYFRNAGAHNTVSIDGFPFVRRAGRIAWSHEVPRPQLHTELGPDRWLCEAKVDWGQVSHQRYVCCLPGTGLWIADLICSANPTTATWYWQLPFETTVQEGGAAKWGSGSLASQGSVDAQQFALIQAAGDRPEGWRCFGYGKKTPGAHVAATYPVSGSLLVVTSIGRLGREELAFEKDGQASTNLSDETRDRFDRVRFQGASWFLPTCVAAS